MFKRILVYNGLAILIFGFSTPAISGPEEVNQVLVEICQNHGSIIIPANKNISDYSPNFGAPAPLKADQVAYINFGGISCVQWRDNGCYLPSDGSGISVIHDKSKIQLKWSEKAYDRLGSSKFCGH